MSKADLSPRNFAIAATHCIPAAVALCFLAFPQGIITTVAGIDLVYPSGAFAANNASYGVLSGIAVNPIDGSVYFASQSRSLIVKFDPIRNTTSVVAGIGIGAYSGDNGPAVNAALNFPQQLAFDNAGNLFIADGNNNAVREIDTHGVITTLISNAMQVRAIPIAPDGSLYMNNFSEIVRRTADGSQSVVAGSSANGYTGDGGPATKALLNFPSSFNFDGSGRLVFVDRSNNVVRRIATDGTISTIAGNGQFGPAVPGPAAATSLQFLDGIAIDKSGSVFLGEANGNLLKIDSSGTLSAVNYYANVLSSANGAVPNQLAFDKSGNLTGRISLSMFSIVSRAGVHSKSRPDSLQTSG